jgi:membrane-bound inhibitor of C-type lysozyme
MADTIHCRHRDLIDSGTACTREATDITYSTGEGRVLDAKCEQHRDHGLATVEVDGRMLTAAHGMLVAAVEGVLLGAHKSDGGITLGATAGATADAVIEALFATEAMRRIILRHYDEREHLHEGEK